MLDWAEVIVIANKDENFKDITIKENQLLVDLVRIKELEGQNNYNGLCW